VQILYKNRELHGELKMGSHNCKLKLDERRKLAKWVEAKMPISEIADRLGRDRSTEPTALTNRNLKSICHRLNTTPRKCLGYQTPAEVFETKLMEIQNRLE